MRKLGLALLIGVAVCGSARPAAALLQFYKVWDEVYLKDNPNEEFVKAARDPKMRCLICHQGKKRTNHNPYGEHLVELLDKRKDIRDVEKIKASIAKVGELHNDSKDDKSPTYAEIIAKGEFPGGTLDEASKEPEPPK